MTKDLHEKKLYAFYYVKRIITCRVDRCGYSFAVDGEEYGCDNCLSSICTVLEELIDFMKKPLAIRFTDREIDILDLIFQNKKNKEIADLLFISADTVKNHISNINQKMKEQGFEVASAKDILQAFEK